MAGDFYKHLFLVGLCIFLTTMDSGAQTTLEIRNITSSLKGINFTVSTNGTGNSANITVEVTDAYSIAPIADDHIDLEEVLSSDNNTEYTVKISSLTPGNLFTVTVNNSELFISKNISTIPKAVNGLKSEKIRFTTTRILWDKYIPQKDAETPRYLIYTSDGKLVTHEEVTENSKNLSKLKPKTDYKFSVSVSLYDQTSENASITFTTLEEPTAVKSLKAKDIRFTSAQITWEEFVPRYDATVIRYLISYGIVSKPAKLENITENSKELSKLIPGSKYTFTVTVLFYDRRSPNTTSQFTTPKVSLPKDISIVAVNTTALNVTWTISEIIIPESFNIISGNSKSGCPYKNKFCVIKVNGLPGEIHTLSVFSEQKNHPSEKKVFIHPTIPLSPNCSVSTTSNSASITCLPKESVFDFYRIDLGKKNEKITRDGDKSVMTTFPDLQPNTNYSFAIYTTSNGTESAKDKMMFSTNPSLDEVNIMTDGNSVIVQWTKPNFERCDMCLHNDYNFSCNFIQSIKKVTFKNVAGMEYKLNVSCNSKWSKSKVVVIPPLPPTGIKLSPTTNSMNISWEYDDNKSKVQDWIISIDGQFFKIPGDQRNYEILNLSSGMDYEVWIVAQAVNKNSTKVRSSKRTLPECITTLSKVAFTNTSITLNLSETNNHFEYYEFLLRAQNGSTLKKNVTKDQTNVIFDYLEAGSEYNISVKTKSGDDQSIPCDSVITARTIPNSPIVECIPSDRSIHVKLTKGQGYIDGFQVSCQDCEDFTTKNLTSHSNNSFDIEGLSPNKMYNISVKTFAGDLWSNISICNSNTNESAPSAVLNLKYKESKKNFVNLSWEKPENENGIIRWYIVEKNGTQVGTHAEDNQTVNTTVEFLELEVKPGYSYSISVTAFTVALGPSSEKIYFTSRTYPPAFNPNLSDEMKRPNNSNDKITTQSITVVFPENPFNDINGRLLNYTVIVSTSNETEKPQPSVLPNWQQFKVNSSIKTYQVIQNCTDLFLENNTCDIKSSVGRRKRSTERRPIKFKIGVEECSKKETSSYCNGYLEPETSYYVKVRAYTQNAFQDTPFSLPIHTGEKPIPGYAIALAIIFPLVTLFFIALAVYFKRRNRLLKTTKVEKDPGISMPRYKPTSHLVNLANYKDHVTQMSLDSDIRFAEEYEDLKDVGRGQEMITAQLMCNRNKNRFANILPYDHSRVKLSPVDDEEGSDYINANYLPGFNSRREYIVTQGPLRSTRDDFWRMITEQNVHNIVMLTRCVEKLREKCDQYWPESGDPMFYGDVQVAKNHETITPDWTITEFIITSGEQCWKLRHFHFTSWPDFGVPTSPQVLVHFVQTVRRSLLNVGPIIIHCSAGVGRSGTFIAVDHCMQHVKENDTLDILAVVYEMRMYRVSMVQTEQQYVYIHHCLLNALEACESEDVYQNVTINKNGGIDNQAYLEDDEGIHVA